METSLQGEVLGYVIVQCDRDVQIARVPTAMVALASLEGIKKTTGNSHLAIELVLQFCTEGATSFPVTVTYSGYVQTILGWIVVEPTLLCAKVPTLASVRTAIRNNFFIISNFKLLILLYCVSLNRITPQIY